MQLEFLGWERPALPAAADWLLGHVAEGELEGLLIVVPGARAGRRLLELLVARCEAQGRPLAAPQIVTLGELPEHLYVRKRPFADDLVQTLAWAEAIRRSDAQSLASVFPRLPAPDDEPAWMALAKTLGRLHRELAADDMNFADVARLAAELPGFRDHARWEVLAGVQSAYLALLDSLDLWDRQTARLFALEHKLIRADRPIVLVATVDMNVTQRRMLAAAGDRVTALIAAPESAGDQFDDSGCLLPDAWAEAVIPLADEQLILAQRPSDQATAALAAIARYDGRYSGDQITVGVADESLVPYLLEQLDSAGVTARYGPGSPLSQTSVFQLVNAVADYLENREFSPLAALVRHPAMFDYLVRHDCHGDWLSDLDRYQAERLPQETGPKWPSAEPARSARLVHLHDRLSAVLAGFARPSQSLEAWGQPLFELLTALFGRESLDEHSPADAPVVAACKAIGDVLRRLGAIPGALRRPYSPAEALRLILDEAEGTSPAPPQRGAVEVLGWLELPLDDAPALVVAGFNEGLVPKSQNADAFLPDALRAALGLDDNRRRYARDAYALRVLAASRERLTLIAGRRDAQRDPLAPSRLWFACDEPTLVGRASRFFKPNAAVLYPAAESLRAGVARTALAIPRPAPLAAAVESMRVTEFRDYLACPYRYYLKHRLQLAALADDAEELDGAVFGSLAHDVLCAFGGSEDAASADAEVIRKALESNLVDLARRNFGTSPRPSVRVQLEQLRRRLAAFANWQARWRSQGWRIEFVEKPAHDKAALNVDGKPMALRGRIDRIDRNEKTEQVALLDYKTGDTAEKPESKHFKGGQWVDLQLPLYRHLAAPLVGDSTLVLGYIAFPKDTDKIGDQLADWDKRHLEAADATACNVVRAIRKQRFWPPALGGDDPNDEFAAICPDALVREAIAQCDPVEPLSVAPREEDDEPAATAPPEEKPKRRASPRRKPS